MEFLNLTSAQSYVIFALVFILSILIARVVYYIFKHPIKFFIRRSKSKLDDLIVDMIEEPIVFLVVILILYFTWRNLIVPANVYDIIRQILWVLIIFDIAYFVYKLFDFIFIRLLQPLAKDSKTKLDDQLLPAFRKITKIIVIVVAFIIALDNFGIDVAALVAGLGIGGLAIALAAKDTLSNMLGSFIVLGDRPFQVGDIVKVGEHESKIKEVGLRSSRIVTWDSTEIIIPNSKITELVVENVSRRKGIRREVFIPLHVDSPVARIEKSLQEITRELKKIKNIDNEFYVVLDSFPDRAIKIKITYWVKNRDSYAIYSDTKNKINLLVIRILQKNKIHQLGH